MFSTIIVILFKLLIGSKDPHIEINKILLKLKIFRIFIF